MGEVFAGRYELADPIGRGGVGAVWRAWDHRRRRYVAAKVLQQSDAHSLLRFVREQALRIDHPHVLAPASWAADDDKVLFTMDLVGGGSLVHLVGDYGPLPPRFVCTLLDQLLAGLAAVHAEDVVHRDIKPANVLLEATGTGRPRLRLSDFGIAMRLGEPRLTETNLVVGTPGYLAPEQLLGAEPDFPADLFGTGLVALYLLEGAKPDAKALVQYFAAHGTPGAPQGIPEPLWQVVASLLEPNPDARFRTATGARKALASAVQLLPEPGPDDELIEIFDQLGSLPDGFGPDGPLKQAPGVISGTGASGAFEGGSVGVVRNGPVPSGTDTGSPGAPAWGPGPGSAGVRPWGPGTGRDPREGVAGVGPSSGALPAQPPPRPARAPSTPSRPGADDTPPSMSDTGSFLLPPPEPTDASPRSEAPPPPPPPQSPPAAPGYAHTDQARQRQHALPATPYDGTHVLSPSRPRPHPQPPRHPSEPPTPPPTPGPAPAPLPLRPVDTATAAYTAPNPQDPPSAPPVGQPHRRGGHRAARRPGPPAKVAVPLLLLALVCYAVGFWALARL
ncbi:serine/threonine protein kinase [Streptomyces zinciresistens K42]|uniref:non-specific serine/threonine protein kinase n=1 Tax=Streptomyces zinciresistens K42 TaxID=700597 RepID=G2GDK4_9ACTN|nr:serine/threonine-protein kinase [Streptomyces zinciresistens]EGX58425.1 serine/threonine protein kinase [Streptomyces zinciresistens K42]